MKKIFHLLFSSALGFPVVFKCFHLLTYMDIFQPRANHKIKKRDLWRVIEARFESHGVHLLWVTGETVQKRLPQYIIYQKNPNTFKFLQNSSTYFTNLLNTSVFCSGKKCDNWRQFERNPLCVVLRYEVTATRGSQHRSPPKHSWRSCLFLPSQFVIVNYTHSCKSVHACG